MSVVFEDSNLVICLLLSVKQGFNGKVVRKVVDGLVFYANKYSN